MHHKIYHWWHTFLKAMYVTDRDEIRSAVNLLSNNKAYQIIVDATEPSRYFGFLTPFWELMDVGLVKETYVDATC